MCRKDQPGVHHLPHIVIPGTPRRKRCEHFFPIARRPPLARSAWSLSSPSCFPTMLIARRWDAGGGPEGRCRETPEVLDSVLASPEALPRTRCHSSLWAAGATFSIVRTQHCTNEVRKSSRTMQKVAPRSRSRTSPPEAIAAAARLRAAAVPGSLFVRRKGAWHPLGNSVQRTNLGMELLKRNWSRSFVSIRSEMSSIKDTQQSLLTTS